LRALGGANLKPESGREKESASSHNRELEGTERKSGGSGGGRTFGGWPEDRGCGGGAAEDGDEETPVPPFAFLFIL
jgi:hypothetical protein